MYETVTAFQAGPANPEGSGLLKHPDGFYYGVSRAGGAFGNGTIYRVSATGEVSTMVHFTGNSGLAKGRRPQGTLVNDGTGKLWGTTLQGGGGNFGEGFGSVFRYNPATGDFTTAVEFTGTAGFAKGTGPQTGLTLGEDGFVWGTTGAGGTNGAGTVFKININNLVFTSILDFTGNAGTNRGRLPLAAMVSDGAGLLWGSTAEGGSAGFGTLYTVNVSSGLLSTVVDFTGTGALAPGSRPSGPLHPDGPGVWWGTTFAGGPGGHGTVFRYTTEGDVFESLGSFTGPAGATPGRGPHSPLVADGTGALWGVTLSGGSGNYGTIFKIVKNPFSISSIVEFSGSGGSSAGNGPSGGLMADDAGKLWGLTNGGGPAELGGIYRIDPETGAYTRVLDFLRTSGNPSVALPGAGLVRGLDGWLWGTSRRGGTFNAGTVYTVNPATGAAALVVEFTGQTGAARGADPVAELAPDDQGNIWGSTVAGGTQNLGTVFRINASTKVFTTITDFAGTNGRNPASRLFLDGSGQLWGTCEAGGDSQSQGGTIFKINPTTGELTTVVSFTGISGAVVGDGPAAGLTPDGGGYLWGTTYEGGEFNQGTIFKVAVASGAFTSVLSFSGSQGDTTGSNPSATLVKDSAGFLWGTTEFGGMDSSGTVFKVNIATGELTTVVEFNGPNGDYVGAHPEGGLLQDPVGAWYGMTEFGGARGLGTIYKISPDGTFQTIFEFTGAGGAVPGDKPRGDLVLHSDGHMYGTTSAGGALDPTRAAGNGQIFRLRFGPYVVTLPPGSVMGTSASLPGTVNPNGAVSTASFEYGTSPALAGASLAAAGTTSAGSAPETVTAQLSGLLPATVYYYRLSAVNPENPNVQYGGIQSFTTGSSSGGNPGFVAWLNAAGVPGGVSLAGVDSDQDGVANALEFVLGGNPSVADSAPGPVLEVTPQNLIFTFNRTDASEAPGVSLVVQTAEALGEWSEGVAIGSTTATSGPGVEIFENGNLPDFILVTIPRTNSQLKFARLKVTIAGP